MNSMNFLVASAVAVLLIVSTKTTKKYFKN